MGQIIEQYLIVENDNNAVHEWIDADEIGSRNYAKMAVKELKTRHHINCRIVHAVCEEYDNGDASPWACGYDFEDARLSLEDGVFDNWDEY